jgi:hypothetical protein
MTSVLLRRLARALPVAACAIVLQARNGPAQDAPGVTPDVFRRFGAQVVKIEIVETGSAAKASLGSGFYVTPRGHIVTNYHVISQLVHDPDRYRAQLVDAAGTARPVRLVAIDVVHDLAMVVADTTPGRHFTLGATDITQGDRLYALGHPHDLGLSIVEGTYNGLLQHTLYPKIHFTGSLNSGMSGGPAITRDGQVAGINVSTEGNQVSFLVPVDRARALLARATAAGYAPPKSFLLEAGTQIHSYQDRYLDGIFATPVRTVTLGPYTLPTQPAPFFNCWADAMREKEEPYETVDHQCSTEDYLFISAEQYSGVVSMHHRVLSSDELNRFRFASLYEENFAGAGGESAAEEDVTRYRCGTRNVRRDGATLRAAFCLRRYRKFAGLYDVMVRAAALGGGGRGVVTTLTLSGVSYENAERVTRRYLESITWTN